jgi:hypothetical protein
VLKRSLYRGTVEYNKTKKRDADGSRHRGRQPKRAASDVITIDAPQLRIISEVLADKVDARLHTRRHAYLRDTKGRLLGSPRGHTAGKHLLAGFIQCGCGATFEAVKGQYVCSTRRRKGASVCESAFTFPVESIDNVFLDALEQVVLSPTFIDRVLDATFAQDPNAERVSLVQEHERLTREVENLTRGIAQGGDIPALAVALSERDKRLKVVNAQLARPVHLPDREVLKAALELRTANWRDVLRGPHVAQARVVLQHLLDLPIRVHNEPMPKWMAAARPEGLLVGLVQSVASPAGFEPAFWP